MVEIAGTASDKPAEDLDLFRRAIEKAGKLSLPSRIALPRGSVAAQARHSHGDGDQCASVLIGNWFWKIG